MHNTLNHGELGTGVIRVEDALGVGTQGMFDLHPDSAEGVVALGDIDDGLLKADGVEVLGHMVYKVLDAGLGDVHLLGFLDKDEHTGLHTSSGKNLLDILTSNA